MQYELRATIPHERLRELEKELGADLRVGNRNRLTYRGDGHPIDYEITVFPNPYTNNGDSAVYFGRDGNSQVFHRWLIGVIEKCGGREFHKQQTDEKAPAEETEGKYSFA